MTFSFIPSAPVRGLLIPLQRSSICAPHSHVPRASTSNHSSTNLYQKLGLQPPTPTQSPSYAEIRHAYLQLAKKLHPDIAGPGATDKFEPIARAWAVLSDRALRRVYDTTGEEGLAAIQSIGERAEDVHRRYAALDGEQLDYLSDTGQLIGGLLTPSDAEQDFGEEKAFPGRDTDVDDACPRSVEEAIWNIQFHPEESVRYYGLWWIYKFKVAEAEEALVSVLRNSEEHNTLGGYGLKRRAALALGAVARAPTTDNQDAVLALMEGLGSSDYFLRYRVAEALSNIAQRCAYKSDVSVIFPVAVVQKLKQMLKDGRMELDRKEEAKSGYFQQESLFDLDKLDEDVRQRLEKVFHDRRQNEQQSRRTTMTPQLGVDQVGIDSDQPFEWILKAVSAISALQGGSSDGDLTDVLHSYTKNSIPLVRYAAHKALYALTNQEVHAEQIVEALQYGVEHHYSQRVLIRDLGDLGYCKGAAAVATCPMVENSFKILALKNMLAKRGHDPHHPDVRNVLIHMDSLL